MVYYLLKMVRDTVLYVWAIVRAAVFRLYRLPTARCRALPDFIIIGAQKSGTSTLHRLLVRHPDILGPCRKEVHFFDNDRGTYRRGANWYRAHFPLRSRIAALSRRRGHSVLTGESSPYYIYFPHAPRRVLELLPDVKLIVILRNPVNRAFSHYNHSRTKQHEPLGFEEAIAAEEDRIGTEVERILADEDYRSRNHRVFSYVARGRYAEQLRRWFECFKRDQILILETGELRRHPQAVLRTVLQFLGVRDWSPGEPKRYNVNTYDKLCPVMRSRLIEMFREPNRELAELIERDFDWDRQ